MKTLWLILIFISVHMMETQAENREFYIAAVELGWDYRHQENLDVPLVQRKRILPSKNGVEQYMKAVYWEYKDSTFSTPKAKPPWMGILGPTIKAEVNDRVVVHFKNFASLPFSVCPVGISYWKQSEGAGYDDATSNQEKEDDAVPPGGYYRYVWDIQPANGPTLNDPECLTYSYTSQVDIIRDFNSGLFGTLLVCKAGSLKRASQEKIPEFILLFAIFDETKSWYGEGGVARERVMKARERKLHHTINGYANSTLEGLKMCRKTSVIWHMIGMGSSPEIHSIHFQDHTLQVQNHRKVSLEVTPMTLVTAEMKPAATGNFLISCQIHSHLKAGMSAFFTVEDCQEPADTLHKKHVVAPEDYADYDLENSVNAIIMNSVLMARSAKLRPKVWRHYIAVEETTWDYAPYLGERDRALASEYLEQGPQRIGKQYKKALYVEYTDDRFAKRKIVERELMGPVLRGEVGDQIEIVLKNWASRPFNIYPNDLTSIHASGGKDLLKGKAMRDFAVQPNETFVYLWKITSEDGPTPSDPKCLTRLYQSTIDPVRDVASGLIGPLVVCFRKTLDRRGHVLMSDKEKHLMFSVFDENKSWYIDENIKKYIKDPSTVTPNDHGFYNSNVMYNVNGFMFNNLRFTACLDDVIFWHVVNVGTQSNFLSVYFTGNIFERDKVHETVLTLFPMTGETISMEMETVGAWEISALDASLKNRGMSAKYSVNYCDQKLPLVDNPDYYYFLAEEEYQDNHIARSSSGKNRTLTIRACKRQVVNNTLATTANTTVHNLKPVCVMKRITVKQNVTAFSKGDIPEDVLQELDREIKKSSAEDRQSFPTESPEAYNTSKQSGSQADLVGTAVLNDTLPPESDKHLEKQPRVRKRAAEFLMIGHANTTPDLDTTPQTVPVEMEEEGNVSLPTPHVTLPSSTTDLDHKQFDEREELVTAEDMVEKKQEENATVGNLQNISNSPSTTLPSHSQEREENATVDNLQNISNSPSTTLPSLSQGSTLKSLMSTLDSKLHGGPEGDGVRRRHANGEGQGSKTPREHQENQVLKDNSDLGQGNFSQFGKERGGVNQTDSGHNALDEQSLDLQILDSQVNVSENANSTKQGPSLDYDDYSEETNSTRMDFDFEDDLNIRTPQGRYLNYYIAAEEVMWDYGIKKPQQLIKPREMRRGMRKYFPEYKKAVFRAYIDKDFNYPAARGELEEHLGIMGPVIQAEVNDLVIVTFKNLASRPYSFHLHGVYDRSQGAEDGEAVQPNEVRVYKWKITRRQGPSTVEFDCKSGAYYSNLNTEKDIHSGLIGPLIVCKTGTFHTLSKLQPGIQQFSLLFTVFDETKSWYLEENIQRFCRSTCTIKNDDPWFKIGNRFAAINGYVAETLPGLLVAQHRPVRWHLFNMGTGGEFHSVHFHGLPFTVRSDQEHRMGIYNLYPGAFGTVEMRPSMAGTWMVECTIGEHQLSGMRAKLLVYNSHCVEPLGMRTGMISDSQITDSGHYGSWESRLARLKLSGSINAWSAVNKQSWIQVDLLRPMLIHGVHTQGATHGLSESFVVQYTLSYSLDQEAWKTYKGNSTKQEMVFIGNLDGSRVKENHFSPPIMGRYIRLNPVTFQNRATLRLELFGSDVNSCSSPMGMERRLIPNQSISASSFLKTWFLTWNPSLARLNLDGKANAWRPKTNNPHEWLQVDFQEVKRVTGVVTQGARSMLTQMMVTEFTVSVSNDGRVWFSLQEEGSSRDKVFPGNNEHDEEFLNLFEPPVFTRYIRIQPKGWYNDIALRLEFLGCSTQQRL
ncbi:coagulation factor VIII [Conger conger]|uniref:coagulation factor VIII n=1 Tax=Conger conger TaxID=82655 RepID=UPI002A59AEE1|nr:coagulation factor VIII [Conger conger]XP_061091964.1 coagulation factor VIII [Conger conger]